VARPSIEMTLTWSVVIVGRLSWWLSVWLRSARPVVAWITSVWYVVVWKPSVWLGTVWEPSVWSWSIVASSSITTASTTTLKVSAAWASGTSSPSVISPVGRISPADAADQWRPNDWTRVVKWSWIKPYWRWTARSAAANINPVTLIEFFLLLSLRWVREQA